MLFCPVTNIYIYIYIKENFPHSTGLFSCQKYPHQVSNKLSYKFLKNRVNNITPISFSFFFFFFSFFFFFTSSNLLFFFLLSKTNILKFRSHFSNFFSRSLIFFFFFYFKFNVLLNPVQLRFFFFFAIFFSRSFSFYKDEFFFLDRIIDVDDCGIRIGVF